MLQPYACHPQQSRGRRYPEVPAPTRNEFQRDRDRIIHSTAFRRLVYKTQVFLNHEGDLFRTRLTHSLEVAQLARSVARALGLNEDLVEAIALAHDLGHTPFGHAGQDALHECVKRADPLQSGFEHNLQSLRVVDELEERYPAYNGLNLTFETREGILKRCSRRNAEELLRSDPSGVAQRFLDRTQPSLEAQLCNLADQIAYSAHDIDDGVRSGLLTMEHLSDIPLAAGMRDAALSDFPTLNGRRLLFETIRRLLSQQVYDVIAATRVKLEECQPSSADAARKLPPLVQFSAPMAQQSAELSSFLGANLYRHPQVVATTERARQVIRDLFHAYCEVPSQMPVEHAARSPIHRSVVDYIAGMTDRFALREHERLTGQRLFG